MAPNMALAIMKLLKTCTLSGEEVPAYLQIMQELGAIVSPPPQPQAVDEEYDEDASENTNGESE